MRLLLALYAGGALIALWRTDAGPATRLGIALLWPIGPAAFAVTVSILLAAAVVAFPLFGVAVAAIAAGGWWLAYSFFSA